MHMSYSFLMTRRCRIILKLIHKVFYQPNTRVYDGLKSWIEGFRCGIEGHLEDNRQAVPEFTQLPITDQLYCCLALCSPAGCTAIAATGELPSLALKYQVENKDTNTIYILRCALKPRQLLHKLTGCQAMLQREGEGERESSEAVAALAKKRKHQYLISSNRSM
ncbi:uncharacterized protein LOC124658051 [Lolium rigidum]|uniref:uncharacterized protein LOC124658051 n=1 Tax=Lolium rigidum TaxID=89674 RepID=UPI001F5CF710|nr:uncharacterized protein LOC124658051 [Lolium rigidum]XP_047052454.1 uncharacterized protein LOC124658051 [Lolium rigidum]